jgi:hypothetical protein
LTAPNHALTGALIGLSVANPWLAIPLAFVSHFVCDAVPHYDPPERDTMQLYKSWRFVRDFLVIGAALCALLVLILALTRPHYWIVAAVCAFLATSPDLAWIPWFLRTRRTGDASFPKGWFFWLHAKVQWKTGPKLLWVEIVWFAVFSGLVWQYL